MLSANLPTMTPPKAMPIRPALLMPATSAREAENSASRARKKADRPFTRNPMLIASIAAAEKTITQR